jgi:hypothetical protein
MKVSIEVETLGRIGEAQIGEVIRTVTLGYAQLTAAQLLEQKPPKPTPGSMKWKSEKQRRYVMAAIARGQIVVPYVRGTGGGTAGSEALNRSYIIDLYGDEAVLLSSSAYAKYVVGDQQAEIHQGRWNTVQNAVETVRRSGNLDELIQQALEAI